MTMLTPVYLRLPPRATWMLEDKEEHMDAWAQEIRQQMPPFPHSKSGNVRNDTSGIMQLDKTHDSTANLAALRGIQPMS